MDLLVKAKEDFANVYGENALVYAKSPGRIEILGNHTDYNAGFVISAAIGRYIVIVGRRIPGNKVKVYSSTFKVGESFSLDNLKKVTKNIWLNYIMGVVSQLSSLGVELGGFEALVAGDIPLGAGLSSSAALEVSTALFLQQLYPYSMDKIQLALTCQSAENKFVGVNCGILDQFSSVMGKKDNFIFLDCRDLSSYSYLPVPSNVKLVIANTNTSHKLTDGEYNKLRESCQRSSDYFASKLPDKHITHLRDVNVSDFDNFSSGLDKVDFSIAKHIVTENKRVLEGSKSLLSGDIKHFGELMLLSHRSSQHNLKNSSAELDDMVDQSVDIPGFIGAKLSGGGFGGCTVNLVESSEVLPYVKELESCYFAKTGIQPGMYICDIVDGAESGSF